MKNKTTRAKTMRIRTDAVTLSLLCSALFSGGVAMAADPAGEPSRGSGKKKFR